MHSTLFIAWQVSSDMSWIFAYGSLMWDHDFAFEERVRAVLQGYHRDFNKKSTRGWGTRDAPGPVLGLEDGGECTGVAFRLSDEHADDIVATIDDREGPSYEKHEEPVQLADGREVTATVWINKQNFTYIGDKSLDERAQMVIAAKGQNGAALDYVLGTRDALRELDVDDPYVEEFADHVTALTD